MGAIKDITDLTRDLVNSVKDRKFAAKMAPIQNLIAMLQSEHSTIIEKNADLSAKNLDLKKKLEKHQSKEAILAKYEFHNKLGIYSHKVTNHFFCPACLLENPPIEAPLKSMEERIGWQCPRNPRHYFRNPNYELPASKKSSSDSWIHR